ncbi:mannosyl-glycoprotein endo-beta-N-acetylglucosamidase [Dolosigranulum pigrum]|uniref:phage tail spike protein n=1 Tax=Dolosigranulum pigrum TaxID=29394 RepID=UPI000DC0251F|nr:phage tail spike protein [Dolosigranulum pigrum]RAN51532.1 mannosyl-glycoprotein endo-beta-N-acetylglucosamidase [Dolosigranulum pigrum]
MIFFTNRDYETVAVADADTPDGLRLVGDELNESVATGAAIYQATIEKSDPTVAQIEAGNFVFVPDFKGRIIVLEIMEVEENRLTKKIIAEDAGLQLINSDVGKIDMKGTLKEFVKAVLGEDSDWQIGRDDIGDSRNLTLKYDEITNQTKRLNQIAGRFDAEISYSFEFKGNRITGKFIHFHKKRGEYTAVRLEVGKELKDTRRNISITNLRTAVLGIGQNHTEQVKTEKKITKTVDVEAPAKPATAQTNNKIEKMIAWFKSREGKVGYSMARRNGPHSYDCSSAVFFAAKHAGILPSSQWIGSTLTLLSMAGRQLQEINRSQIQRGDIFVSGTTAGAGGHTGVVLDRNRIIHCNWGSRGIATTKIAGWTGGPPVRWFRFKNIGASSPAPSAKPGKYWSNDNLVHHDLGWKLSGLTAHQIDNWVKATSPGSPFNGQGKVFLEAQKQSGLDARYILAHAALESAWGTSNLARKYNNFFGIGAFDNNPENAKNYSNSGLASGIIGGANWIAKHYYNSQYKQTTLQKMRHNNGVHQYATDPNWHTKIANVMKRSERYTSPAKATTKKEVTETVVETKEVERETNLIGYEYDDGRYFVDKKGRVCDREANKIWSKPNTKGKYITRIYESQATSQKTLFDETLLQLKNNNEPEVSYEVDPEDIPDDVHIGDTVRIIDHDYNPALYLDARLVEVTTSTTTDIVNQAVFANFEERPSGITGRLIELQALLKNQQYNWENQPYALQIESSSSSIFKDNLIDTNLIAVLTKAGINQTANVDGFLWERISAYPDKLVVSDADWNEAHQTDNEHVLNIKRSDVELEATFVCSAMLNGVAVATANYTIKNLSIGIFKQKEEPNRDQLVWGDIWKWDDGQGNRWEMTWKNDRWEDTVTKRDLDLLELTPGPPGRDGEDGLPGKPGEDGRTSYAHFAYADSEDGRIGFTRTATGDKQYIGFYSDFTPADSTNPADYAWSRLKGDRGDKGIPGKAGIDGRTPYFHTAWADSADGRTGFTVDDSADKTYIGTYTDYTEQDSRNPADYNWMRARGRDGRTTYTWIRYADDANGRGISNDPRGKTYIGLAYNKTTANESNNPSDYMWSLIKGEDGVDGARGADGQTLYTWIKYSPNASGTPMTQQPQSNTKYIGIAINKTTRTESDNYRDYTWSKYVGDDGERGPQGVPGRNGTDGRTTYTWIKYANNASGAGISNDPRGKTYIGLAYNKTTANESNNPSDYMWSLIKGEDGVDGARGADGQTLYTWIKYSPNASGTPMTQQPQSNTKYIGIAINKTTRTESDNYRDYTWSKYVGDDGERGPQGVPGRNGTDGSNAYVHIAYANSADGTADFSLTDSNRSYIGTYTDNQAADSTDPNRYKWTPFVSDEIRQELDGKASANKLQDLEVHFAQYPTAEELALTSKEILKQQGYINSLNNAITSNALDIESRIKIIEQNVGAGRMTIQAIATHFNFGEEGVVIGRDGEQVRLRIINDKLEILDGNKVVATFGQNETHVSNLKVEGAFEFGHHIASKVEINSKKFTVISPNI